MNRRADLHAPQLLLRNAEVHIDRTHCLQVDDRRSGSEELSDVHLADSEDSGERSADDLALNGRSDLADARLSLFVLRRDDIIGCLRDHILGAQTLLPFQIETRQFPRCFRGLELRRFLPRVEFQQDLAAYFGDSDETLGERGKPFYLGGDEGLILAPVAFVLDLARSIKEVWDRTAGATEVKATLSMGIALFDRERPLGAAIEIARRSLEAHAKRMEGKNGLAVSVQTASGSEWTAVAHWGESWERIAEAVKLP